MAPPLTTGAQALSTKVHAAARRPVPILMVPVAVTTARLLAPHRLTNQPALQQHVQAVPTLVVEQRRTGPASGATSSTRVKKLVACANLASLIHGAVMMA